MNLHTRGLGLGSISQAFAMAAFGPVVDWRPIGCLTAKPDIAAVEYAGAGFQLIYDASNQGDKRIASGVDQQELWAPA